MNRTLLLLFAVLLLLGACKKEKQQHPDARTSKAMIMGLSPFKHLCGGKYWIKIDDTTAGFTFNSLPKLSGINPDFTPFRDSIPVMVSWRNAEGCGIVFIDAVQRRY